MGEALGRARIRVHTCPADSVAMEMGTALAANLVLLGFASSLDGFPFPFAEVCEVVDSVSAAPHREVNLRALERGRELA